MKLAGKTAIVTGAGGGIGRATALCFGQEGALVVALDIDEAAARAASAEIEAAGGSAIPFACDVCDAAAIGNMVATVLERTGRIDIVVNNAGGSARLIGKMTTFAASEQATWEWVLRLNLLAPMILNHAVLPHMMERKSGKLINLGSVAGVNGLARLVDYSAAKGGIIGMTRALAIELGEYGINVNCVSPGSIESRPGSPQTFLRRAGQPWEVAALLLFLASNDSDFITGQNYVIDGGRCLSTTCL